MTLSFYTLGGDIFIHAKSNQISKLFELSKLFMEKLPDGSVAKFQDDYGWVYQNGRDLSGFIDGTENPADDESRYDQACEKKTGGSYTVSLLFLRGFYNLGPHIILKIMRVNPPTPHLTFCHPSTLFRRNRNSMALVSNVG